MPYLLGFAGLIAALVGGLVTVDRMKAGAARKGAAEAVAKQERTDELSRAAAVALRANVERDLASDDAIAAELQRTPRA
jgi:hypothetical protein